MKSLIYYKQNPLRLSQPHQDANNPQMGQTGLWINGALGRLLLEDEDRHIALADDVLVDEALLDLFP